MAMSTWAKAVRDSMSVIERNHRRILAMPEVPREKPRMETQATAMVQRPVAMPVVIGPETEREQQATKAIEIANALDLPRVAQAIGVEVGTGVLRRAVLSLLQEQEIPVYPWLGVSNYLERLNDDVRRRLAVYSQVKWTRVEELIGGTAALSLRALELIKQLTQPLAMISPIESQAMTLESSGNSSGDVVAISYQTGTGRTTIERTPPKPRRLVHFKVSSIEAVRDPFLAIFGVEGDPIVIDYWDEPGYKPFATQ